MLDPDLVFFALADTVYQTLETITTCRAIAPAPFLMTLPFNIKMKLLLLGLVLGAIYCCILPKTIKIPHLSPLYLISSTQTEDGSNIAWLDGIQ